LEIAATSSPCAEHAATALERARRAARDSLRAMVMLSFRALVRS
jgi:hypothetical protein